MPFRLFAVAAMAAIGATLGLMVARALTIPLIPINPAETDILLLHHLGLGVAGALALLPLLLRDGMLRPGAGLGRGLLWGGAIFLVFSLFPWLAQPETRPGQVPAGLQLWLFSVAASATGLWLIVRGDWQRRLAGGILLVLPLLLGLVLGERPERLLTPGFGEALAMVPELAVWRDLGLNLLFWLLLGVFSAFGMRRTMPARSAKTSAVEAPPEG